MTRQKCFSYERVVILWHMNFYMYCNTYILLPCLLHIIIIFFYYQLKVYSVCTLLFSETCKNGKFTINPKEIVVSHHLLQQTDVWFSYKYNVLLVIVMCVCVDIYNEI